MPLPSLVNLLKLVAADVQVLQLGQFERGESVEFIVLKVQALQAGQWFLLGKNLDIFDSVVRQIKRYQFGQVFEGRHVAQSVQTKVNVHNFFDLICCFCELFQVLSDATNRVQLETFSVFSGSEVGQELEYHARFQN